MDEGTRKELIARYKAQEHRAHVAEQRAHKVGRARSLRALILITLFAVGVGVPLCWMLSQGLQSVVYSVQYFLQHFN